MESEVPPVPESEPEPFPATPCCTVCANPLRDGANFCPTCGAPQREGLAPPPRRLTAREILYDVQGAPNPVSRILVFYFLWLAAGIVSFVASKLGAHAIHIMLAVDVAMVVLTASWVAVSRPEVLRLYAPPRGGAGWLILPLLTAWPIAAVINLFVSWLSDLMGVDSRYTPLFFDHGYGWSWVILLICIQPAVVEELAFRGVIQTSLRDVMGPWEAIIVSAVAFSIMHWSGAMLVPFVLLGAYLGWLRRRTDSLWPPMIAHFFHNLLVVLDERGPFLPG